MDALDNSSAAALILLGTTDLGSSYVFLTELASVPDDDRRTLTGDMYTDPQSERRVGEHLVLTLQRLDDFAKATLLAKAFKALLLRRIDLRMFERLASAIDRARYGSLSRLRAFYQEELAPHGKEVAGFDELQDLAIAGLVRMEFGGGWGGGAGRLVHNEVGNHFVKYVLAAA